MANDIFDRRKFIAAAAAGTVSLASCAVLDTQGWQSIIGDAVGTGATPLPPLKKGDGEGIDDKWFTDFIANAVETDPANSMVKDFAGEKIFKESLVGFVKGDDPIFSEYKNIIGPFHHTPAEVMDYAADYHSVKAPAIKKVGVVSFILPLADKIVEDNAKMDRWCSARWAQGRLYGEMFCRNMTLAIIDALAERGVMAVAPDMMPDFRKKKYPGVGWASPWSHRHIAFAAGLGSFGMNDFFISEKGSAHRCGSIVVAAPLEPNRERLPHYRHNCLHHQTGLCLVCAERCPVGATTEKGHDKDICSKNVLSNIFRNQVVNNVNIYGCGLCSTATPCSRQVPL